MKETSVILIAVLLIVDCIANNLKASTKIRL